MLPPGPRRQVQRALNGAPAAAHLGGDGCRAPALAVQGPRLVIARLSLRRALGGLLLGACGEGRRWHRDRQRPIGQRDRLLMHGRIDRVEGGVMRGEDLVQGFPEILQ
jgi:hypothetical protein